jgi:hypothetical protein
MIVAHRLAAKTVDRATNAIQIQCIAAMLTSMSIGGIAVVLVNTTRDVLGPFKSAPNATGC